MDFHFPDFFFVFADFVAGFFFFFVGENFKCSQNPAGKSPRFSFWSPQDSLFFFWLRILAPDLFSSFLCEKRSEKILWEYPRQNPLKFIQHVQHQPKGINISNNNNNITTTKTINQYQNKQQQQQQNSKKTMKNKMRRIVIKSKKKTDRKEQSGRKERMLDKRQKQPQKRTKQK